MSFEKPFPAWEGLQVAFLSIHGLLAVKYPFFDVLKNFLRLHPPKMAGVPDGQELNFSPMFAIGRKISTGTNGNFRQE